MILGGREREGEKDEELLNKNICMQETNEEKETKNKKMKREKQKKNDVYVHSSKKKRSHIKKTKMSHENLNTKKICKFQIFFGKAKKGS